jgi:uncharacterized membrane protein YfcA
MFTAWIGALLVGLVLGLLGSGGSILTVPVLVYLVGEPNKLAIAESLGIVTLVSFVGALPFVYRRQVSWRCVGLFGGPGMGGAYLGAWLSTFMTGALQLAIFAVVMLLAAVLMFRREGPAPSEASAPRAFWKVMLDGLGVGILTGLVGVGGGFLIVPALVLLGGLSMHLAIGTSLLIISAKSVSGFVKYVEVLGDAGLTMHWDLMLVFSIIGIAGSVIGGRVGTYIPQARLKRGFALFLVIMGVAILGQNVMTLMG